MVDPTIASLFRDAAKLLRARFEVIRSTNPHAGEKGAEVEEILKQFLNEHLPQRFRAGSGIVLDTDNALSRQQDVIVYDALSSPLYRLGRADPPNQPWWWAHLVGAPRVYPRKH